MISDENSQRITMPTGLGEEPPVPLHHQGVIHTGEYKHKLLKSADWGQTIQANGQGRHLHR